MARELVRERAGGSASEPIPRAMTVTPAAIAPLVSLVASMNDAGRRMVGEAVASVVAEDPNLMYELVHASVREGSWTELAPLVAVLPEATRRVFARSGAAMAEDELMKLLEAATSTPHALQTLLSVVEELPTDCHTAIAAAIEQRPPALVERVLQRAQSHDKEFTLEQLPPPIREAVSRSAPVTKTKQP